MLTTSVPVKVVARVLGKQPMFVTNALREGSLPFGFCIKQDRTRIEAYISPKLLYDYTGYEWKGEEE